MESESRQSPSDSPNKRLKTLTSTSDYLPNQSPTSLISKGKFKLEENDIEIEPTDCCGICLSEVGADCNSSAVSRGCIDSCSHYFCFVCIMEWAKVESRCPLCKRRFSTIRRPPKPPIFPSERVVNVPVRDQVYNYLGNATTGPLDPYSQVKCSGCNSATDENLLLLCDLCDSAAHTYCVGLGATVPDGDWFCQDCKLLKDEQAENEINTDPGNQISSGTGTVLKIQSQNEPVVSVSDIVREPSRNLPPPSSATNEVSMIAEMRSSSSSRQEPVAQQTRRSNAQTLRHRRFVHDRIHILRENWNRYQSGALTFSAGRGEGSSNQQRPASCSNQQSSGENGSSSVPLSRNKANEIDKAWKMMEIAKSSIVPKDSKHPTKRVNGLKQADYTSSKHPPPKRGQSGCNELAYREKTPKEKSFSRSAHSSSNVQKVKEADNISSSSSKARDSKEKNEVGKSCLDRKADKAYHAKSEIQSLVKLNLKLLTKDNKLEVDAYKEVARLATHSILAACGLEKATPDFCSIPESICSHPDEARRCQRSTLMPNSCRKCFYEFVKDVVSASLLQKKKTAENSCYQAGRVD